MLMNMSIYLDEAGMARVPAYINPAAVCATQVNGPLKLSSYSQLDFN